MRKGQILAALEHISVNNDVDVESTASPTLDSDAAKVSLDLSNGGQKLLRLQEGFDFDHAVQVSRLRRIQARLG